MTDNDYATLARLLEAAASRSYGPMGNRTRARWASP